MKKVAFNVIIEKELHTKLKVVASLKGVSMLSIIEAGIKNELKEIERKEGIKCNL